MTTEKQDIFLRVYMEQTENKWEAICLDLDIVAQGETRLETMNLIEEMISTYIESMQDYSVEDRKRLLARKAPLGIRLSWAFKFFAASIFTDRNRGDKMSILSHHHCPA